MNFSGSAPSDQTSNFDVGSLRGGGVPSSRSYISSNFSSIESVSSAPTETHLQNIGPPALSYAQEYMTESSDDNRRILSYPSSMAHAVNYQRESGYGNPLYPGYQIPPNGSASGAHLNPFSHTLSYPATQTAGIITEIPESQETISSLSHNPYPSCVGPSPELWSGQAGSGYDAMAYPAGMAAAMRMQMTGSNLPTQYGYQGKNLLCSKVVISDVHIEYFYLYIQSLSIFLGLLTGLMREDFSRYIDPRP